MGSGDVPGVGGGDLPPPQVPSTPGGSKTPWTAGVKGSFIIGSLSIVFGMLLLSARPGDRARDIDDSMTGLGDLMSDVGGFFITVGVISVIVALGFVVVRMNRADSSSGA